jgi:electron transport complex protein RnfB
VNSIVLSIIVLVVVGLIIGIMLGVAGKKLAVKTDEKVAAVRECLPGNNCGACGYPGCDGMAEAIATGKAPVNGCPVGGAPVAEKVAKVMGVSAGESEKMVAFVKCSGTCDRTRTNYDYTGVQSCKMIPFIPGGGSKKCANGCFGFGDCVEACQFDAIHIVNGVAFVDRDKCTSCQACIKACPQHLIELVPWSDRKSIHVACSNTAKGKPVIEACDVGCIACRKCENSCPKDAIHVENNIAHIDYEKCVGCGICYQNCPRGTITTWDPKQAERKQKALEKKKAEKAAAAAAKVAEAKA